MSIDELNIPILDGNPGGSPGGAAIPHEQNGDDPTGVEIEAAQPREAEGQRTAQEQIYTGETGPGGHQAEQESIQGAEPRQAETGRQEEEQTSAVNCEPIQAGEQEQAQEHEQETRQKLLKPVKQEEGGKPACSSTPLQVKKRENQKRILAAFVEHCGNVEKSAAAAGLSRERFYYWLRNDDHFKSMYQDALEKLKISFEAEIWRRGYKGVDKPLSYKGQLTGETIKEYSDNLAIFAMKKLDPSYRDGATTNIGIAGSGPLEVQFISPDKD